MSTVGDVQGADDVAADGLRGGGSERKDRNPRVLLLDDAPQFLILGPEICAQSDRFYHALPGYRVSSIGAT